MYIKAVRLSGVISLFHNQETLSEDLHILYIVLDSKTKFIL